MVESTDEKQRTEEMYKFLVKEFEKLYPTEHKNEKWWEKLQHIQIPENHPPINNHDFLPIKKKTENHRN